MQNPGDWRKSYPTAKNLLVFPIRKIGFNRLKSLSKVTFPLHQIAFSSNHLMKPLFLAVVILLYHILNLRLYVYTCCANLTNQCLLNVAFSMRKALNNRSFPKQNFHFLHLSFPSLQCYFENPVPINACFPFFHTPFL